MYPGIFPMCIQPTTDGNLVGKGTAYPVGMTLVDAMTFFWKSKKFQITGTIKTTFTNTPSNTKNSYAINDFYTFNADNGGFIPNSELDYICLGLTKPLLFDSGNTIANSGANTIGNSGPWFAYGNVLRITSPVLGYYYNGLYYICIWWTLNTGDGLLRFTTIQRDSIIGNPYSGNVKMVINANTYNIPFQIATGTSGLLVSIDQCDLTMVISEQWAFA